jgi:hypothetical protein
VALLEAAIVIPVAITLVLGIIEVGWLFRSASVATNSARAGARLAASQFPLAHGAGPTPAQVADQVRLSVEEELQARSNADLPQLLWIYRAAPATGDPVGGAGFTSCLDDCFQFSWDSAAKHFVLDSGGWSDADACGANIDSVGVYVRMRHNPVVAPAALSTRRVKQHTVMRLEPRTDCTVVD